MGIIAKALEKRYSLSDLDKAMDLAVWGSPTSTGINITAGTAMNCVPYMHGVRLISEVAGAVPLIEYRRLNPRGKERAFDRRVYHLLHDEPNPEMDAMSFKSALTGHAITGGNAFAEIQWNLDTGAPEALWPLNAWKMKVGRDSKTHELLYVYTLPDGQPVRLPSWRVWHMPGFGFDGIIGYDNIFLARETIATAMAIREYGARFFGNGANPGGVLEHPNHLSKDSQDNLRKSWNEMHQGLANQHRLAILDEGMKYHQVSISPENAQWLESQKFSIEELSRLLNLTPHMMFDLSHATFSNIEHLWIEFKTITMKPWFTRWAQTSNRKLLLPEERNLYFCEALVEDLLQGDSAGRAAFYKELFYMGTLSPNDIREKENMNPITDPGGDKYYIQANMVPMEMAGQKVLPAGNSPSQNNLGESVKRIAAREKQNILRALKKFPDDAQFRIWLEDFYRDFPEYIKRQAEPVLGDEAGEFTERYVEQSKAWLKDFDMSKFEALSWESLRLSDI
jgi:HK97 family phage portal protein